jgi:hypothetical protein
MTVQMNTLFGIYSLYPSLNKVDVGLEYEPALF